jgi:hypothetical protein
VSCSAVDKAGDGRDKKMKNHGYIFTEYPGRPFERSAGLVDPFAKQVDPFAKQVDPLAKQVDPLAKQVDPFGKFLKDPARVFYSYIVVLKQLIINIKK